MIDLLLIIITSSLVSIGVYVATMYEWNDVDQVVEKDGRMIFWFIGYWSDKLPEYLNKPLTNCLPCMGSVWSIVTWLIVAGMPRKELIAVMLATCGLNYLIQKTLSI